MATSKASTKKDDDLGPEVAYPVTHTAPKEDDKVAYVVGDADHEDAPVRTARPDVPIAAVLAAGAGEHKPPDPDKFDRDGRPKGDIEVADNTRIAADAETRETR
jgi:hypothetical protein